MCRKIRCDGESKKILQIFLETKQGLDILPPLKKAQF